MRDHLLLKLKGLEWIFVQRVPVFDQSDERDYEAVASIVLILKGLADVIWICALPSCPSPLCRDLKPIPNASVNGGNQLKAHVLEL